MSKDKTKPVLRVSSSPTYEVSDANIAVYVNRTVDNGLTIYGDCGDVTIPSHLLPLVLKAIEATNE